MKIYKPNNSKGDPEAPTCTTSLYHVRLPARFPLLPPTRTGSPHRQETPDIARQDMRTQVPVETRIRDRWVGVVVAHPPGAVEPETTNNGKHTVSRSRCHAI